MKVLILAPYAAYTTDWILDIETDLGALDPQSDFFEPLQKSIDQCRNVKVLTKYVYMASSTLIKSIDMRIAGN